MISAPKRRVLQLCIQIHSFDCDPNKCFFSLWCCHWVIEHNKPTKCLLIFKMVDFQHSLHTRLLCSFQMYCKIALISFGPQLSQALTTLKVTVANIFSHSKVKIDLYSAGVNKVALQSMCPFICDLSWRGLSAHEGLSFWEEHWGTLSWVTANGWKKCSKIKADLVGYNANTLSGHIESHA